VFSAVVPFTVQQSPTALIQQSPVIPVQQSPIFLSQPQASPVFNIPVRLSLAPRPGPTVHHYYVPKKKFKKSKKGWLWF
jgi:hypothetical protein